MANVWMIGEILLGIYLAGFAIVFLLHLFFLLAFWGELRHSGHATWHTVVDILRGSLWGGLIWPWLVYRGYHNLRTPG